MKQAKVFLDGVWLRGRRFALPPATMVDAYSVIESAAVNQIAAVFIYAASLK